MSGWREPEAESAARTEAAGSGGCARALRIGWTASIACFLVLAAGSLAGVPSTDEAAFAYVAKGLLEGELPYVDRWDQKGPLTYLLALVGIAINDLLGIRILAGLFLLASAAAAYRLIREEFGALPACLAVVVLLAHYPRLDPGGFTEHYAMPLQLLALLLFVRIDRRKRDAAGLPCLLGILGAAAFLLRPDLVGVWLAVGMYWIIQREGSRLGWAIAGGASTLAVAAGTLLLAGGLTAYWDAAIVYNYHAYGEGASLPDRLAALRYGYQLLPSVATVAVGAWLAALYAAVARRDPPGGRRHPLVGLGVVLLPVELALASVAGYPYEHYYATLLPALLLMLGYATAAVAAQKRVAPTLLSAALLVGSAYGYRAYNVVPETIAVASKAATVLSSPSGPSDIRYQWARHVRALTPPGDTVLVWGFQPIVHLLAERDSPTRFFYQFPLMMPGYASPGLVEDFVAEVRSRRPATILDVRNPRLPPLDRAARGGWRPEDGRYLDDAGGFDSLFEFVEAEYDVAREGRGWVLYASRSQPAE